MENKSSNNLQSTLLYLMTHGQDNDKLTLKDSITSYVESLDEKRKTSTLVRDSYGNSLLSVGNNDETAKFTNYTFNNDTLNWPLWFALYNSSWVFKRAIDKPAQDQVRCGIKLLNKNINNKGDISTKIKQYDDDMIQLIAFGALTGGSIACAMFDNFNDDDYAKPLNKEKLRQAKTMTFYTVDRWYGVAPDYDNIVTDMNDIDYGKPKFYNVTMADGKTYRYHHDYVIRYEHRFAPKLIKNGMLQGWGYSEGSHIMNELMRDDKLKSSIQSLVDKALIEVIKMSGMRGIFMGADNENEEQLRKRLEMVNWGRNFNSLTFLDKDDDYTQHGFSGLGGLSDVLQQNMWQIAAAVEMQGILFGDMKGGFSTDTEALERYDETIQGRCKSYCKKPFTKLITYVFAMNNINEKPDFEFNSLLANKINEKKMENINSFVGLLSRLLADGVISTKLYAKALNNYTNNGTIDFNLTDEEINKLDDDFASQFEGIDLNKEQGLNIGKLSTK